VTTQCWCANTPQAGTPTASVRRHWRKRYSGVRLHPRCVMVWGAHPGRVLTGCGHVDPHGQAHFPGLSPYSLWEGPSRAPATLGLSPHSPWEGPSRRSCYSRSLPPLPMGGAEPSLLLLSAFLQPSRLTLDRVGCLRAYACLHVCLSVFLCIFAYACMYVYIMHECVYARVYVRMVCASVCLSFCSYASPAQGAARDHGRRAPDPLEGTIAVHCGHRCTSLTHIEAGTSAGTMQSPVCTALPQSTRDDIYSPSFSSGCLHLPRCQSFVCVKHVKVCTGMHVTKGRAHCRQVYPMTHHTRSLLLMMCLPSAMEWLGTQRKLSGTRTCSTRFRKRCGQSEAMIGPVSVIVVAVVAMVVQ